MQESRSEADHPLIKQSKGGTVEERPDRTTDVKAEHWGGSERGGCRADERAEGYEEDTRVSWPVLEEGRMKATLAIDYSAP